MTEEGIGSNKLLETYVTIMTNAHCQKSMNSRLQSSKFPADAKEFVVESLPDGINDHMLCTTGIRDLKSAKGTFSVSKVLKIQQTMEGLVSRSSSIKKFESLCPFSKATEKTEKKNCSGSALY